VLRYGSTGKTARGAPARGPVSAAHDMTADDPALLWRCYMQLCHVEEAFRTLKGDLGLRPSSIKNPRASKHTCSSPSSPTA